MSERARLAAAIHEAGHQTGYEPLPCDHGGPGQYDFAMADALIARGVLFVDIKGGRSDVIAHWHPMHDEELGLTGEPEGRPPDPEMAERLLWPDRWMAADRTVRPLTRRPPRTSGAWPVICAGMPTNSRRSTCRGTH
jgi:hypothetical protein